ncbi:hypothetical protein CBER1_07201 [Cercospora berteroae]|uniref:F-box domain-containing protein n=1 Tax=Cercospora berteroae TaxID=357750 RepID=A0A2S6BRY4_9PEZI|nr:hypothetical protein CBER1_07201 [Cercospora berteroae]
MAPKRKAEEDIDYNAPEQATAAREPEEARAQSLDNANAGGQQTSEQEIAATATEAQSAQSPEDMNGREQQAGATTGVAAASQDNAATGSLVQVGHTGPLERPFPNFDQPNHPFWAIPGDPSRQPIEPEDYRLPQRYLCEISGCEEVLGMPELTDIIMLFLPPQDLLRYRRVCREWKETIDYVPNPEDVAEGRTSKSQFRRALFLEPDEEYLPPRPITQQDIDRTKRIAKMDYERVNPDVPDHSDVKDLIRSVTPRRVAINPAFFRLEGRPTVMKRRGTKNVADPSRDETQFRSRRAHFLVDPLVPLDENDTRLDMFITQPPIKKIGVYWEIYGFVKPTSKARAKIDSMEGGTWDYEYEDIEDVIEREEGIRYRDVVKLTRLMVWETVEENLYYQDNDLSEWKTDMIRTFLIADPEVDFSCSQCWGSRGPRDGREYEPEWLHAWNLLRDGDYAWMQYLQYHHMIKLGPDNEGGAGWVGTLARPPWADVLRTSPEQESPGVVEQRRSEYTFTHLHEGIAFDPPLPEGWVEDKEAYDEKLSDDEGDPWMIGIHEDEDDDDAKVDHGDRGGWKRHP